MRYMLRPDTAGAFVTDEHGRDVYWVRSAAAEQVGLWSLRDLGGNELLQVAQHGTPVARTYGVYRAGQRVGTVVQDPERGMARWRSGARALITGAPDRMRYRVRAGATELDVDGDPSAIEYDLNRDGRPAATVGLRWLGRGLQVGTTVTVADGEDPELILALVAMIETAWGRL
jgi:uncharacterized protein YxjI